MIQKDKELLLKDLCARLPYGVKCYDEVQKESGIFKTFEYEGFGRIHNGRGLRFIENIKPYLFPLSSMTEEQKSQYSFFLTRIIDGYDSSLLLDWLNKNHFDYRGLIEKGLAIDATGLNIY